MVIMKRIVSFLICLLLILPSFSQTEIHGSTGLDSGLLHGSQTENPPFFYSSSVSSVRIENSTSIVKALLECSASLSVNSLLPLNTVPSFSLNKAYFKTRIPFFNDSFMRLSIGKMPVSWGYGTIFNAGDILFTQSPPSSPAVRDLSSSSLLPSFSDWAFHLYLPLSSFVVAEAAFLPPLEPVYIQEHITRTAVQFQFLPYALFLESAQLGASVQHNIQEKSFDALKLYAGLDGTIIIDYNLCSSIEFSPTGEQGFAFNEKAWSVSAALFYSFSNTGIRGEILYYPLSQSIDIFSMLSFSLADSLAAQAVYSFSHRESSPQMQNVHLIGAGLNWNPVKDIRFSLTWNTAIEKPDNFTSVMLSGLYSF